MSKERPILFNGEMVRAILDGRKTQTRRVVKPQPEHGLQPCHYSKTGWAKSFAPNPSINGDSACTCIPVKCPFGSVGDRLRISENVKVKAFCEDWYSVMFDADNLYLERPCDVGLMQKIKDYKTGYLRGVHLSTAFARPTRLEITGVRVERLNDISERDAIAEGIELAPRGIKPQRFKHYTSGQYTPLPRHSFESLWQSINGPASWAANPWVWVVSFKRITAQ